jgi:glycosyltransferase involved in cell wall biosynthesis
VTTIAIDLTAAITGGTGISRYVTELAAALPAVSPDVRVRPFAIGRGTRGAPDGTRHLRVPLRVVDRAWRLTARPRIERLVGSVDSVHASGALLPPARAPIVAVVYDLAALDHPELHPARDAAQLQRYVDQLHRAEAVIAISTATGDRIARHVPSARIHVVPIGRSSLPPPEASPLRGRRYLLAVGAPVPRKGYDRILRALARLGDTDVVLALVGPAGSEDEALVALADELGLADRVHRTGAVTEAQLAGWYADAAGLVAPSVEEGFGLPLVEALAAGTPVVASDIPVHREVTGGGALLVPAGDEGSLVEALEATLDRGPSIAAAVEVGTAHVARYTWEACARATLAVHRAVQ